MVETLGDALDHGWRLELRCTRPSRLGTAKVGRCEYAAALDLVTLVCTRGRAFPLSQLASRMKCPRCGDIRPRILFVAPGHVGRAVGGR